MGFPRPQFTGTGFAPGPTLREGSQLFSLLVVAALGSGSTTPATPAAAVTTRYKLEIKAETTIDLSAFGQGVQTQTANLAAWLVVTLNDSAGGKSVRALVDSVTFVGTAPVSRESLDSTKGAVVRGFVDAAGRVKNLTTTPESSIVMQVQGMINSFFPKIKSAAKLGDKWADTVEIKNAGGGNNTNVTLAIDYTAGARETVAGLPALKVSAVTKSTVSGTMENPNAGTMEVEGTGSGTGTLSIGSDGRFLGGSSTSNIDQRLKVSMAPTPIPVKTAQTVVVTVVK